MTVFGIKSVIVLRKNLIVNPSTIKKFSSEAKDFLDKEVPKVGSNYTCLAVTLIDSVLGKDENYYLQAIICKCFLKTLKNTLKKKTSY